MAHICPFPVTRGHLPRRAIFPLNERWPAVAGTTVVTWHGKPGILTSRTSDGGRSSDPYPPGVSTCYTA